MKRVAVISDSHCGHVFGLTPPQWQGGKYSKLQRQFWAWYKRTAGDIGHVDVLICNGDMIDGDGAKSGGTELVTTDRLEQADIAAECVRCFDAETVRITAGTAYHAGACEEFERPVAEKVAAKYGGECFIAVEGVKLHARHHISTAQLPHTKGTAILRTMLMDALSATIGAGGERADVVIRSHAHSFMAVHCDMGTGFVTDGLQLRSRYGRRLDGWSDVGVLVMDIDGEEMSWTRHRFNPSSLARVAERIA